MLCRGCANTGERTQKISRHVARGRKWRADCAQRWRTLRLRARVPDERHRRHCAEQRWQHCARARESVGARQRVRVSSREAAGRACATWESCAGRRSCQACATGKLRRQRARGSEGARRVRGSGAGRTHRGRRKSTVRWVQAGIARLAVG